MLSKNENEWKAAIDDEMAVMKFESVIQLLLKSDMPEDTKTIKTMWVYSVKSDHLGNVFRYRARLVAIGVKQRPGIDLPRPSVLLHAWRC